MKILLVDDHPVFRAGLKLLLKEMDPSVEVLQAGTCAEGIRIARQHSLNLVFLDLNLPDGNGLDCLRDMKAARPSLPVVLISGEDVDRELIERALELQAMGFVPKSENADMIVAALRTALAGGVFLPAALWSKTHPAATVSDSNSPVGESASPVSRVQPHPVTSAALGITPRQADVLRLLILGLPNKRIAIKLGISIAVVKKHVSDLLAHFKVVSRTHLVVRMAERGITFGSPEISHPRDDVSEEES
jgi:two-component system, NarL family, nitrate/nitrite response regulator NarL